MTRAKAWFGAAVVLLVACSPCAIAQIQNACPGGCGDLANPVFVNVYWDSSKSQWDQDEIGAGQADLVSARIDALTQAILHSSYFTGLAGYGVVSAKFLRSVAGDCAPLPFTIQPPNNYLNKEMQALAACVLAANPDLNPSTTILNVFLPPQVVPTSPTALYCSSFVGDHDQFWSNVEMTRVPTNPACNPNMAALSLTLTHEMVEGATDLNAGSPWGWKTFGGGGCDEIGDFCRCPGKILAAVPAFLYGAIAPYWVDGLKACWTPGLGATPPGAVPTITLASVSGSGPSTTFTLRGPSLAGSAVGAPWDLKAGAFGDQTLYLNALIAHPGKASWGAGNFEGLPPDQVGLNAIKWSDNGSTVAITVNGFKGNYGQTITESFSISVVSRLNGVVTASTTFPHTLVSGITAQISGASPKVLNGSFPIIVNSSTAFSYLQPGPDIPPRTGGTVSTQVLASIEPGDTVTFTYSDPLTGLSTTASGTTPFPAKITAALNETRPNHPTVQDAESFFGKVSDSLGGGMEAITVTCASCSPPVNAPTAGGGAFILSVTPAPVAGSQSVTFTAPAVPPGQVTASFSNVVFPVMSSITPAIGPTRGGVPAAVQGAGFDPAATATSVNFAPRSLCTTAHPCSGKSVAAQSVSPDFASATVQVPASPLPLDGSGTARVSAIVNGAQSAGIEYLYIVPGKPVLFFAPRVCGGGELTPNVYGLDGSPRKVSVQLSAQYNAFVPAVGAAAVSTVTVTSGQSVTLIGAGPVTATDAQTSQHVTQSFPVPQVNPCTAGTLLWPSIEGVVLQGPGPWAAQVGPECADCPLQLSHTVLWTPETAAANATAFVTIAGRSASEIRTRYSVRSVDATELNSYLTTAALAAVQSPGALDGAGEAKAIGDLTASPWRAGLPRLNFVGPVADLRPRARQSVRTKTAKVHATVTFRLPRDAFEASAYRIVHLVLVDGSPEWIEDAPTTLSGHGRAVTVTTDALGIYALAQLPRAPVAAQQRSAQTSGSGP